MKPDGQREAALFQAAAQLNGSARMSFLDSACQGDAALRQRLQALLAAHQEIGGALAETATAENAKPTLKLEVLDELADEAVSQKIDTVGQILTRLRLNP